MNKVNIGMVGYKFMGKAHSHAYRDLHMFFPEVAAPDPEGATQWNFQLMMLLNGCLKK